MNTKILTPLELKVMNALWASEHGFVKDILEAWPDEPKPAYNTVSTIVRILHEKGFLNVRVHGRTHEYLPAVSKDAYQKNFLRDALENVFAGSAASLLSSLVDDKKISSSEIEELKKLLD